MTQSRFKNIEHPLDIPGDFHDNPQYDKGAPVDHSRLVRTEIDRNAAAETVEIRKVYLDNTSTEYGRKKTIVPFTGDTVVTGTMTIYPWEDV